jgi:hypothetical protein
MNRYTTMKVNHIYAHGRTILDVIDGLVDVRKHFISRTHADVPEAAASE